MSSARNEKLCVILLAMGGPSAPGEVRQYLYKIFSDRSLIRLPGGPLLQKPFARMISLIRRNKVRQRYDLIGGKSPLLSWTQNQAQQIEAQLRPEHPDIKCFIGMRYSQPSIGNAIGRAYAEGYRHLCFLPLYPQYSLATTGSSFKVAAENIGRLKGIKTTFIKDFHDDPGYIALLRGYIDSNIKSGEWLLFSAHSLPQEYVDDGDPYVDRVMRSALLTAGERPYSVSFQSRSGPVTWVGPDTIVEAKRLLAEHSGLFVVPISFVCDHIETLYEIDIDLRNILTEAGLDGMRRMPMFNDDPRFGAVLANIVKNKVITGVNE